MSSNGFITTYYSPGQLADEGAKNLPLKTKTLETDPSALILNP